MEETGGSPPGEDAPVLPHLASGTPRASLAATHTPCSCRVLAHPEVGVDIAVPRQDPV